MKKNKMPSRVLSGAMALAITAGMIPTSFATGTTSVNLSTPTFTEDNAKFTYNNASCSNETVYTMTVTVSAGSMEYKGETTDYNRLIKDAKNQSLTFIWNSSKTGADVKDIISKITFTYVKGMEVNVAVDGNANVGLDKLPEGTTLTYSAENEHYYMYVPYDEVNADGHSSLSHYDDATGKSGSWRNAHDLAMNFKLGGRQGYLAALDEDKPKSGETEQHYLQNLVSGARGWVGATALQIKGNSTTNIGNAAIGDQTLTYSDGYTTSNGGKWDSSGANAYFYWAAGPNAGTKLSKDYYDNGAFSMFGNGEFNHSQTASESITFLDENLVYNNNYWEPCAVLYASGGTTGAGLNDIHEGNFSVGNTYAAKGYFVEFGGMDSDKIDDTLISTGKAAPELPNISLNDAEATEVGTLKEAVTQTLDFEGYTSATYEVVNRTGDNISGTVNMKATDGSETTGTISNLKYGDYVKVTATRANSADVDTFYFRVLDDKLNNGEFSANNGTGAAKKTGVGIASWHTTASDQNMELGTEGTYLGDKSDHQNHIVAELNAYEVSSLYQEITTTPGETLTFSFSHRARIKNMDVKENTMAVVIGPAQELTSTSEGATTVNSYTKADATSADLFQKIYAEAVNTAGLTDENSTVTVTYEGKKYLVMKCTSGQDAWKKYSGTYTVPEGQTETVFAFVSADSGSNAAMGNLLSGISFAKEAYVTAGAVTKTTSDKLTTSVTVSQPESGAKYYVKDKDGKIVIPTTEGAYKDATSTNTLDENGYYVNNGGEANTWGNLPIENGPYTVYRVADDADEDEEIGTVVTVGYTNDNCVTWYEDEACQKPINGATRKTNDFEDNGVRTVYVKSTTGKPTFTATANEDGTSGIIPVVENLGNGVYKVTYTQPTDDSYTLNAAAVNVVPSGNPITGAGVTTADDNVTPQKTYDGDAIPVDPSQLKFSINGGDAQTAEQLETTYNFAYTYETTDGTVLADAPTDVGNYYYVVKVSDGDGNVVMTKKYPFTIAQKAVTAKPNDITVTVGGTATPAVALSGVIDGDVVALGAEPTFTIKKADGTEVALEDALKTAGTYTIIWNNADNTNLGGANSANYTLSKETTATLTVNRRSSGHSSSSSNYTVTVKDKNPDGGNVSASVSSASKGQTITITANPTDGYELSKLTVAKEDGSLVDITSIGNGKYTFTMPASKVTITGSFAKEGATGDVGYLNCPKDETCPIYPFPDAQPTAWYHDGVHYCIENELMQGFPNGTFQPNGNLTRGQLVTMLWRLDGKPSASSAPYTDVSASSYCSAAVSWASDQGIVNGYENGKFGAYDAVTREQFAAILYRYAKLKGIDVTPDADVSFGSYNDAGSVSSYASNAMQWALGEQILNGVGDATLSPRGTTSRAQAANLMQRFITGTLGLQLKD